VRTHPGRLLWLVAGTWLATTPTVSAQGTAGRILGLVKDASGAVLSGVAITVSEARTAITRTEVTDTKGSYVFVNLPTGDYTVTAEIDGFKTGFRNGCVLAADGRLSVDFSLEAGGTGQVARTPVSAGAVNATSGEIVRTIDRVQVAGVTSNGRNSLHLATLIPGAPLLATDGFETMTSLEIGTSINGSRQTAHLLTLDGGFNMDSGGHDSQVNNLGVDFVDHVSVKTSSYSAEYGRSSGPAITVVTRSGSNRFAGSAFEYMRRDAFDANGYFANLKGVRKTPLTYDNFGFTVGGPIAKDRVFAFGGAEWKRVRRSTSPVLRSIPTSAMRGGDFSAIPVALKNPYTGQAFAGGIIPAGLITADGQAIANLYAAMARRAASYDDTTPTRNALFEEANPFDFRQELLRVDLRPGGAHRVMARLAFDHYSLVAPYGTLIDSQLPTVPTERTRPGRGVRVEHDWSIRHGLNNELAFNYSGSGQAVRPLGDAWKRATYGFAFPQLYAGGGRYEESIPGVTVGGFASFEGASGSLDSPIWDYSLSDGLTCVKGAHAVKLGGLFVHNRHDQNGRSNYAGDVAFGTSGHATTTGNAFADALLGNFRTYSEAQIDPVGRFRFRQVEAYASDDWRVSGRLTIQAGVRYAWQTPTIALGNNIASFDRSHYETADAVTLNTNGTIVPGSGNRFNGLTRPGDVPADQVAQVPNATSPFVTRLPTSGTRGYYHDQHLFAPRVSAAWKPAGRGGTSVRAGVGLSYDRPEDNVVFPLANNPPFTSSSTFQNGNLAAPADGTAAALAPWAPMVAVDPSLEAPAVWNWSVGVQHELPWYGLLGEAAYVGNRGVHLLRRPDVNDATFDDLTRNVALKYSTDYWRPYKGFSSIEMYVSDGWSDYNALQLFLSRRRGRVNLSLSYTYSRSNDTASSNTDGVDPGAADQNYYYGPSSHDRRHVFVGSWTWRLPFFEASTGVSHAVLGGWEVSGVYRYQSGAPFTVTASTSIGTRRADYLGGDPYAYDVNDATGVVTWLDPTRFAAAPAARLGNSSRNAFVGPGYQNWDITLRKVFVPGGRVQLQLEAAFFNAFNRVNWNSPASSLTGSTPFGTITSAAPPRNIQLGVRLSF
jgi:hypothetical protein